jgi:hypothetical protein
MVLQKVLRLCFIRFCALILASLRLGNGMIEIHVVEFYLEVNGPSEVVAAVHGISSNNL